MPFDREQELHAERVLPSERLMAWGRTAYKVCYITGAQTIRMFSAWGRRLHRILAPAGRLLYKTADFLLLRHLRSLAAEGRRIASGFSLAGQRVKDAYRRSPWLGCVQVLCLPLQAVRRHRKVFISLLNLAAPVAAAFVLMSTLNYWKGLTFALSVEYDGEQIGYIADESVFDEAAHLAAQRVLNTDHSFEVERIPKMTLAVVPQGDILDENAICDRILSSSSDSIAEMSGLYVEDEFVGALQSGKQIQAVLKGILSTYQDGADNETVDFLENIKIVDGLYPLSTMVGQDELKAKLTSERTVQEEYAVQAGETLEQILQSVDMRAEDFRVLNPYVSDAVSEGQTIILQYTDRLLQVQTVKTVTYTEEIPYATETLEDTSRYAGYKKIKINGRNGLREITAEVRMVNGQEISRTIVADEVVENAVNEVIVVGAKKYNPNVSVGDGLATGKFIWPLPSCTRISSPFGNRSGKMHRGIDISGNGVANKPVLAADGGTVAEVNTSGSGGGYGLYVIIDHGGGYRTVYSHCNLIEVKKGQKVSQGQEIALAGDTGNSVGAHLHFEIRIDGVSVNPVPYVS